MLFFSNPTGIHTDSYGLGLSELWANEQEMQDNLTQSRLERAQTLTGL